MRLGPVNFSKHGITWSKSLGSWRHYINRALTEKELGEFQSVLTGGHAEANMITLFKSIPEVFAPVDTIAAAVCSCEWQLRRIEDDEVVYDNQYWNRIYERPNWKQDFSKLIYNAVVYKYVTGNRYFYAYVPDTMTIKLANVVNLWSLPPQYTEPVLRNERTNFLQATAASELLRYYDFNCGRDRLKIHPDYVVHDTYLDIDFDDLGCSILKGISPFKACEMPMSNLMAVYKARNVIYVKRGALGFIVSRKSDASGMQALTKTEKEDLVKDYQDAYGLDGKKSTVAITSMPVDFIKVAMSIAELEPFKETEASSDAIYAVLRVPRELKPRSEGSTYENQKTAKRTLYTNVAIPEAVQIAVILSDLLKLSEIGYYLYPCFDKVDDLQENKKEKSDVDWRNNETLRVRFLHGIITLNEWIVAAGYTPITGVPIYEKRMFQMDEAEMAIVKAVISLKSVNVSVNENSDGATNQQ